MTRFRWTPSATRVQRGLEQNVPRSPRAVSGVHEPDPKQDVPGAKEPQRWSQTNEGLYTRENVLSIEQEERERKKRRKFATDFDLIDKTTPGNDDDPNFLPNKSPWLFLIALEAILRTFAKAGTYMVKDHESGDPVIY